MRDERFDGMLAILPGDETDWDRRPAAWTVTVPLVERIMAEYGEMPGLSLTAAQAARLWGLDREACAGLLQALVAAGRLRCTRDGRYSAAGDLECDWRPAPQAGPRREGGTI